jgi:hypothetical protein
MSSMDNGMEVVNPSQVMSQNFSGRQISQNHGTADTAMAAQVKAQVEARYLIAMHRPRDLDQVLERLLRECRRPSFADSAMFSVPRGGSKIEGLSIRFAEAAARCFTNINTEVYAIYDSSEKRTLRIQVTDLESNQSFSRDVTIVKSIERRRVSPGQEVLGVRTNSQGQQVYSVQATDDELMQKEGALVSKNIRTLILRIIPGWLQDEAMEVIQATARDRAAQDPDAQKRLVLKSFNSMGITASAIKEYLGCEDVDMMMTPDEIVDLRALFASLKEGHVRWADVLGERRAARRGESGDKDAEAAPEARGTKAAMKMLQKQKAEAVPAPKPAPADDDEPWRKHLSDDPA